MSGFGFTTTMVPPATGTNRPSATATVVLPSDPCLGGSNGVPPQATIIAVGILVPVLLISLLLGIVMYRSRRNRLPGQMLPTDSTNSSGSRSGSRGFGGWLRSWTTRHGDSTTGVGSGGGGMTASHGAWPGTSVDHGRGRVGGKPSFAASSMASRKDSDPGLGRNGGTWYTG